MRTTEKYITYYPERMYRKYRVRYKQLIYGEFNTMTEAIKRRDQVVLCYAQGIPVPTIGRQYNSDKRPNRKAEMEQRESRKKNMKNDETAIKVPYRDRPKFKDDRDACWKCKWHQGLKENPSCGYWSDDDNHTRYYLHVKRTGKRTLDGFTHGMKCTEWEPANGS